jgi:hypothetical protein
MSSSYFLVVVAEGEGLGILDVTEETVLPHIVTLV